MARRRPRAAVPRAGGDRRLDHRHERGPRRRDAALRRRVRRARRDGGDRDPRATGRTRRDPRLRPHHRVDGGGHLRPAPRRHVRPGRGRRPGVPRLAPDGRAPAARPLGVRRRPDVRAPDPGDRGHGPRGLVPRPGANDGAPVRPARPAGDAHAGAARRPDPDRRRERPDRARDLGARRARGDVGARVGLGGGAGGDRAPGAAGRRRPRGRRRRTGRGEHTSSVPRHRERLRRAHEAAHHRPAADHDGAGDGPRRARPAAPVARARDPDRRHARRRLGERDQHVPRSGHRPGDAADPPPAAPRPSRRTRTRRSGSASCWRRCRSRSSP